MLKNKKAFLGLLLLIPLILILILWDAIYPFILAVVLSVLIDPAVEYLEKKKISRVFSSVLISLAIFLLILLFFIFVAPVVIRQAYVLLGNLKEFFKESGEWVGSIAKAVSSSGLVTITKKQLMNSVTAQINTLITSFFNSAIHYLVQSIQDILMNIILIPFTIFYLLKDKERILSFFKKYLPKTNSRQIFRIYGDSMLKIKGYIKSVFLIAIVTVIFMLLLFSLWGVKGAILLALFAGILSMVPYAGALFQMTLIALLQMGSGAEIYSIIWLTAIQQVFFLVTGFYIQPKITSMTVNLHPLWVVICLMCGSYIYGVVGMIFSIPIFLILQTILLIFFRNTQKNQKEDSFEKSVF